jgi:lipoteichoic acid synthase
MSSQARALLSAHEKPSLWTVWSRASLAWVFGLCLPLVALAVHFKLIRIAQRRIEVGPAEIVDLFVSDVSTLLAWTFVSLGLVAWAERRSMRVLVHVGLQAFGVLYAAVLLGAHGYFMSTGSSLDFPMLSFSLAHFEETSKVIGSAKSVGRVVAFGAAVVGVIVLPWLFASFAKKQRVPRLSNRWLALLHTWSFAGLFLAVAIGARSEQGLDLTRDPFLNIALTMNVTADAEDREVVLRAKQRPTGAKAVAPGATTQKKNVVVILLESTGAWATSLYEGPHATTPFLAELGAKSVVLERMYAVEPHTSKALSTTLCGIEPRPGFGITESVPGGILGKCLPDLLKTQGYRTAYFQGATREFEARPQLVRNLGFDHFVSGDQLPKEGLKRANYFGYEDRQLLPPLYKFIDEQAKDKSKPFMLTVLTNQPHHEYLSVPHYGNEKFVSDTLKNRYLNAVRYDDFVMRELFAKFESAGLMDNTIFLILGDHGEGFGEHGRYAHDDTIYEEGLHIPFLIHDRSGKREPARIEGLYNELDVVPTVLDLLDLQIVEGSYIGRSVFAAAPERPIYAACYNENKCIARLEGNLKYIHHFDRQRDELFDISRDPLERKNLLKQRPDEGERMRADVLDWYRQTRAMYREVTGRVASLYVSAQPPKVEKSRRYRFGSAVEYLGYSTDLSKVKPGGTVTVTYHFRVLSRLPEGYRLFIHGYDGSRRFTWDHVPVERMHPEEDWRAGQYVSDPHRIRIPKNWRSNKVLVRGGFWKPRGERLLVSPKLKNNDPVLAEIDVER